MISKHMRYMCASILQSAATACPGACSTMCAPPHLMSCHISLTTVGPGVMDPASWARSCCWAAAAAAACCMCATCCVRYMDSSTAREGGPLTLPGAGASSALPQAEPAERAGGSESRTAGGHGLTTKAKGRPSCTSADARLPRLLRQAAVLQSTHQLRC